MRLILDLGSGASLPDDETAHRFVDEVAKRDTKKHEIIFKAQLFTEAPPNTPLWPSVFRALYTYASEVGYQCTASVFDYESLEVLLRYDVPFVKIACRPDLYWLAGEVPRKVPVYMSTDKKLIMGAYSGEVWLDCVPKYPATIAEYEWSILANVSDHTVGWALLRSSEHIVTWEKHIKLPDTIGPDAGPWAVMPDELAEVIS